MGRAAQMQDLAKEHSDCGSAKKGGRAVCLRRGVHRLL